jgi:hypothetical protein
MTDIPLTPLTSGEFEEWDRVRIATQIWQASVTHLFAESQFMREKLKPDPRTGHLDNSDILTQAKLLALGQIAVNRDVSPGF